MARAALLFLPAAAILAFAGTLPADARSKAFCREWAEDVANRNAGPEQPGGALMGAALQSSAQPSKDGLTLAPGGSSPAGANLQGQHWQTIFRHAYAECRAS